jgi:serine phosphatase RsbU (regulator of sigma subunit)
VKLNKGDFLYIYSDGFSDQFGGKSGKKYKSTNFKKFLLTISSKSMEEQNQLLSKEFNSWKGDLEQIDDVCVMGVRI